MAEGAESSQEGIVYWLGYVPLSQIRNPEIAHWREVGLFPSLEGIPSQFAKQVGEEMTYHTNTVGQRCVAIIQPVRDLRAKDTGELRETLEFHRSKAPDYPLDVNCAPIGRSIAKAKFNPNTAGFSSPAHCDDFARERTGQIVVTKMTKVTLQTEFSGMLDRYRGSGYIYPVTARPNAAFGAAVRERQFPRVQFMEDRYVPEHPHNIAIVQRLLIDGDKLCAVLTARQGENVWQDRIEAPSNGRLGVWEEGGDVGQAWIPMGIAEEIATKFVGELQSPGSEGR